MFWTKELFFPLTDLSLDLQDKDFFSSLIDLSQMDVQECENFAPVVDLSLDLQEKKTITKSNSSTFVMSLKISFFNMDVGGDSK
jgi:hypothetical protein